LKNQTWHYAAIFSRFWLFSKSWEDVLYPQRDFRLDNPSGAGLFYSKANFKKRCSIMREGSKKITKQEYGFNSKEVILKRLNKATLEAQALGIKPLLKKLGFSDLPLEEIQDRLSKSRRTFSQEILIDREQI
jgi:hypothetical protein